jgi:hypothetical protein
MNLTLTTAGRLTECLLLSYRTPAAAVRPLVPRGLELVTRGGFAFWNVVACTVEHIRPSMLPEGCGVSYRHVAYRLHVQAHPADASGNGGAPLRGLYFVRSDADSRLVGGVGNLVTDFHIHPADVELAASNGVLTLAVRGHEETPDPHDGEPAGDVSDAIVRVSVAGDGHNDAALLAPPPGSPFASAEDADRVLRYQPLGLSVDLDGRYVKLAEVIRAESKWSERPVRVLEAHFRFFESLGLGEQDVQLERATRVAPVDYRWKLGRRVALRKPAAASAPAPAAPALVPPRPSRAAA